MNGHDTNAALAFLPGLLKRFLGPEVTIGPIETVIGAFTDTGYIRPMPSTVATVSLDNHTVSVLVPASWASENLGPVFYFNGRHIVLPIIRLFEGSSKKAVPSFLTYPNWLSDALERWYFQIKHKGNTRWQNAPGTIHELLSKVRGSVESGRGLTLVSRIIHYALVGCHREDRVYLDSTNFVVLPPRDPWLRPAGVTKMAQQAATALVLTARTDTRSGQAIDIPKCVTSAKQFRFKPTSAADWGLDPVHTSEHENIRLVGRLADGVRITSRKLVFPRHNIPLSVSSRRLPFAGFNDPRRLLLAAKMQDQAMCLTSNESPLVQQDRDGRDPPGVNLRVGYLAWQGWNHEDAWVVSESAADKLEGTEDVEQWIAIRAVEQPPQRLVKKGQCVRANELLIQRQTMSILLAPSFEHLASLHDLDATQELQPEPEDGAKVEGRIEDIEFMDLLTGSGITSEWRVYDNLLAHFRMVIRIRIRRTIPLAVGDKLANRHGHKGVVGKILPNNEMPYWRGQPLDALIDPISVVNRSNWGQVMEALSGAATENVVYAANVDSETVLKKAMIGGANEHGQFPIDPPSVGTWLTGQVRAVAGVQFIMRLPKHAHDELAVHPAGSMEKHLINSTVTFLKKPAGGGLAASRAGEPARNKCGPLRYAAAPG